MPLDDLVSVIETLQKRIRDHGAVLRENETRTRVALIDPLLQALGWYVSDPAVVKPEYSVSGRRADYALLGKNGKPVATVEAKKLGESLESESHMMQMLNYANISGIKHAGLTDGDHWKLYDVFPPQPQPDQPLTLEERCILHVSVRSPAHETALKLLMLWRPNLASGRPTQGSESIFREVSASESAAPLPEPREQPSRPQPDDMITIQDICQELRVEEKSARRKLRDSPIEKPGNRWAWKKTQSKEINRVKQLLGG